MTVTLEEMKSYLRVDFDEEDALILNIISGAERLCMDILRTDDVSVLEASPSAKIAVMYTAAYLYEHREDADHHKLTLMLRSLLFGDRRAGF